MSWFGDRAEYKKKLDDNAKVEIVAHKRATRQQITETKKVNDKLNKLLVANGFTLKIYLAAGGSKLKK